MQQLDSISDQNINNFLSNKVSLVSAKEALLLHKYSLENLIELENQRIEALQSTSLYIKRSNQLKLESQILQLQADSFSKIKQTKEDVLRIRNNYQQRLDALLMSYLQVQSLQHREKQVIRNQGKINIDQLQNNNQDMNRLYKKLEEQLKNEYQYIRKLKQEARRSRFQQFDMHQALNSTNPNCINSQIRCQSNSTSAQKIIPQRKQMQNKLKEIRCYKLTLDSLKKQLAIVLPQQKPMVVNNIKCIQKKIKEGIKDFDQMRKIRRYKQLN